MSNETQRWLLFAVAAAFFGVTVGTILPPMPIGASLALVIAGLVGVAYSTAEIWIRRHD